MSYYFDGITSNVADTLCSFYRRTGPKDLSLLMLKLFLWWKLVYVYIMVDEDYYTLELRYLTY